MTTGTNTPEIRSARRWTAALPCCTSSTSFAICASWVSEPTRVAPHDQPAARVDGGADDDVADRHLDRRGLAGEHGGVDGRTALDHLPVGGDLLAGLDHDRSPTASSAIGIRFSTVPPFSPRKTMTSLAPSSSRARRAAPARRWERFS
jgi:hypothetical protein